MKTRYILGSLDQPLYLIVHNVNGKKTLTYDTCSDEAYATRFDSSTEAGIALATLQSLYAVINALNLVALPLRDGIAEDQPELGL